MRPRVDILDSTLRDGAQAEGISFSVEDKLKIVEALDQLGVTYIEAGNPGSNPKDVEFFARMRNVPLKKAKLVAFGSTRRRETPVTEDKNLAALLSAETPVVTIFGKSWDFHVTKILQTTLEENLRMIQETVAFLKERGKEVIYDAEHFFDGYKNNPDYAMKTLRAALDGGADCLVLCDTNGGCFPSEIVQMVQAVKEQFQVKLGIHTHNDCGMAVAN
ncbi:MAG TPA: citramalate synthase, partial [Capillibacterium sp.]